MAYTTWLLNFVISLEKKMCSPLPFSKLLRTSLYFPKTIKHSFIGNTRTLTETQGLFQFEKQANLTYHEARLLLLRGFILVWTTPLLHNCVWLLKMCDPQQAVLPKPLFLWTKPPQQMCDMAEYFIWPQDLDINASSRLSWSWFNLRVCFSPDGPENRISLITFI